MPLKCWYVYILSSLSGTLYVGMADDLRHRMSQHKLELGDGFTKKYKIDRLMYFEVFHDRRKAAAREQQIKKFRREKKIALFMPSNPSWKDLTEEINKTWAMLK
ncbi:MAG TPA: GIY-YIG nuclease family protein [Candidatus Angelobacter sp.]